MTDRPLWAYAFDDALPPGVDDPQTLLGGKGASLAAMTRAGLNVPPGFTITIDACREYFERDRRWPEGLEEQVRRQLDALERKTGRTYGRGNRPLLVSVRSGAAVSMPGMMDTLLNCGLHLDLSDDVGDSAGFWRLYLQFIRAFAQAADDVEPQAFDKLDRRQGPEPSRALAVVYLHRYQEETGKRLPTDPSELLVACIDRVFDSWHTPRAEAYRRHRGIDGLGGTAVNIQAMFPSEVSGVVFTQDPNNLSAEQMTIEASYGLGEAVVSGEVTPDRFAVCRKDCTQVTSQIGHKASVVAALGQDRIRDPDAASLQPREICELATLALQVEQHFGHPIDMEWGFADGQFALLQARAIRGLEAAQETEAARQAEIERLQGLAGGQRRVWVAHNLGETLRGPTPLTWDIVRRFMTGDGGFGRMYQQLGYRPSAAARRDGFLELVAGRIYADPDRLAGLFWDALPVGYELDSLLADPSRLDHGPTRFDPDKADGRFLLKLPGTLWAMWRSSRTMRRARRNAHRVFQEQVLPDYLAYIDEKRRQDLSSLSDAEVLAELHDRRDRVLDRFGPESLKPGFVASSAYDALAAQLVQLLGPQQAAVVTATLTAALEGDTTFEQDLLLYRVANGEATLQEFIDRFGHGAVDEMELAEPRWRENPEYLRATVARLRCWPGRNPQQVHAASLASRRQAEAELPSLLESHGGSSLREPIQQDLERVRRLLPYRESGKHYLMMGYELIRTAIVELARRWRLGDDIFYLTLEELDHMPAEHSRLCEAIARRRQHRQAVGRLDMPEVIDSQQLDDLGLPRPLEAACEWEATAVAAGVATGPARIVIRPQDAGELGHGYVLVCPSTDPGWTPLFLSAAGLIVERGGVLSHGAIVARDVGIPAVVCPDATRLLHDGDQVRVDGNRGAISVVEPGARPRDERSCRTRRFLPTQQAYRRPR